MGENILPLLWRGKVLLNEIIWVTDICNLRKYMLSGVIKMVEPTFIESFEMKYFPRDVKHLLVSIKVINE